ncbi:MAG: HIT domain-containing protein [Phycisphaerales bacterium]|nr:HIT domain-containing protein [Phycisphaerales bacterium]
MEYIGSLSPEHAEAGCFLCRYWSRPAADEHHGVVWRGKRAFVTMNRFPYTNGHLIIAPETHTGTLDELDAEVFAEMNEFVRRSVRLLGEVAQAQGFNIGMNLNRCAGAGLPDHVHAHVVPRWAGDTNFMAIVGDVRVIPEALDAQYRQLVSGAERLGFR